MNIKAVETANSKVKSSSNSDGNLNSESKMLCDSGEEVIKKEGAGDIDNNFNFYGIGKLESNSNEASGKLVLFERIPDSADELDHLKKDSLLWIIYVRKCESGNSQLNRKVNSGIYSTIFPNSSNRICLTLTKIIKFEDNAILLESFEEFTSDQSIVLDLLPYESDLHNPNIFKTFKLDSDSNFTNCKQEPLHLANPELPMIVSVDPKIVQSNEFSGDVSLEDNSSGSENSESHSDFPEEIDKSSASEKSIYDSKPKVKRKLKKKYKTKLESVDSSKNKKEIPPLFEENEQGYKCIECLKTFVKKMALYKHLKEHKIYECYICKEKFKTYPDLRAHKTTHAGQRCFQCHICQKIFLQNRTLKQHLEIHTNEMKHQCPTCGKLFHQQGALNVHIRYHHTKEKRFKCSSCNYACVTSGDLTRHMLTHTGEKPHCCHYCGARFSSSSSLVRHIRIHTGERPHKCTYCDKQFIDPKGLREHTRTHTGEKPYCCYICGNRFSFNKTLTRHIRAHTGEKPYKCSYCGKGFADNKGLREHTLIHTGEKPYACSVCQKRFTYRHAMKKHILQEHPR